VPGSRQTDEKMHDEHLDCACERVEKGQSKQNRSGLIVRKRMRPRSKCCSVK